MNQDELRDELRKLISAQDTVTDYNVKGIRGASLSDAKFLRDASRARIMAAFEQVQGRHDALLAACVLTRDVYKNLAPEYRVMDGVILQVTDAIAQAGRK